MDASEKCMATAARCVCKLDKHPADVFHECADEAGCNGSWNGEIGTESFDVGRYPMTGNADPVDAMILAINTGGWDEL